MNQPNDVVKQIKQATRRKFTADEKIRIVLEGLRGEIAISELCRREGLAVSLYYKWSKAFLDAGKNGLTRDILRLPPLSMGDWQPCSRIRLHTIQKYPP
jgi:transposase-like protein